jgi:hypothetical protein
MELQVNRNQSTNNKVIGAVVKHNYTRTEKAQLAWKRQIKELHTEVNNNKIYWDEFSKNSGKAEGSLLQYKSTIFNFMENINKDLCLVTKEDIDNFVADAKNEKTRNNKLAHIRSILSYIIKENVANCLNRVSKETLINHDRTLVTSVMS